MKRLKTITLMLLFSATLSAAPASAPSDLTGHWEGSIQLPGMELNVMIDLSHDAASGRWSGTIDIPAQGAEDLPLEIAKAEGAQVMFAIRNIPGKPTFDGRLVGARIEGDFTQGGAKLKFWLGREKVAAKSRPQDPKPPLPYREEEVSYQNGQVKLAGALTIPPGAGPFPAALLITGSGPQNRDEELMNHRPFKVIADRLTRGGIVVLRVDDRGVGGSTGKFAEATSEDFAGDVEAGVAFLKLRKEVAPQKVGLIGHSEGGVIAPMVASRSKEVAFIVMLAGTGVNGADVLVEQNRQILLASGAGRQRAEKQAQDIRQLVEAVKNGGDDPSSVRELTRQLVNEQIQTMAATTAPATVPSNEAIAAMVDQQVKNLTSKWFKFFLSYDPRVALRKVGVPVLALNGERDTQVWADQNVPEIERALGEAGNKDVTVRRLPELNHLFQRCKTGSPDEYAMIEETFDEDTLALIRDWIIQRFGPGAP